MAKVALLIGVSEYGPGFNWLPGALKDIEAMQRILQHPDVGGFTEVETLKNPDPLTMQVAIEALFKDKVSDRDDLPLLFFSGHCVNDHHNQLYFATRLTCKNTKGELVKSTAVPFSFVQDITSDSRSKQQVVTLDCCFSNAFADVWSAKNYGYVDVKSQVGGPGRVVLAASTSTQLLSHKGFELSNYTRYLVEGIETGAADLDRDQHISVYELHQYISRKAEDTDPVLKPVIYAIGDSYNIQLAKSPIKPPRLRSSENLTFDSTVGASKAVPPASSSYDTPKLLAKEANSHSNALSSSFHPPVPTPSPPKSLLGASFVSLLALAGMLYGITRWQDLQQLPMTETIAADTNYKYQVPALFEHRNTVWSLAFSPDSQILASSSGDKTIKLWQLKSGELLRTISGAHLDTIWSVAITPNGQTIVSGSGDKTIKIWNLNTGRLLRTLVGHTDTVRSVAITPNGQTIVSGSGDKTIKIWDLNTGKLLHILYGHTGRIISVAISPDGKIVASGSNDNTIKLWHLRTGKLLHTLSGHSDHINSVAFKADGKVLVSGSEDHSIKLWNPQTGALLHTLSRHKEDVYAVAISPDGKTLASGDKDGEIKLGQ